MGWNFVLLNSLNILSPSEHYYWCKNHKFSNLWW